MKQRKKGRQAFYKTPGELQAAVDRYFQSIAGVPVYDEKGVPVLKRNGEQLRAGEIPPTLTGLAMFCGYKDRRTFTRQKNRSAAFADVVLEAQSRIERSKDPKLEPCRCGRPPQEKSYLAVINKMDGFSTTVLFRRSCNIRLQWESMEDGIQTGDGVLRVKVNGVLESTMPVKQGDVVVDVQPFLRDRAGEFHVDIDITDSYGRSRRIKYRVLVVYPWP